MSSDPSSFYDDVDDVTVVEPEHQDDKPAAADWRNAKNVDEFVSRYDGAIAHDGQVNSWNVPAQDPLSQRVAELQEAERLQREAMARYVRGDERPEYASAGSLAEMMEQYATGGGIVSEDFTLDRDADGVLRVYENG